MPLYDRLAVIGLARRRCHFMGHLNELQNAAVCSIIRHQGKAGRHDDPVGGLVDLVDQNRVGFHFRDDGVDGSAPARRVEPHGRAIRRNALAPAKKNQEKEQEINSVRSTASMAGVFVAVHSIGLGTIHTGTSHLSTNPEKFPCPSYGNSNKN